MNVVSPINSGLNFEPAYRQLQPVERTFVDKFVEEIEAIAEETGQRLLALLQRPLPPDLDQRSRGMLARPLVRAAIADRVRELSQVMEISTYRTMKELKALAYSNLADYMKIDQVSGQPYFNLSGCTYEQLAAIQSIEIEENPRVGRKFKFKLHDKLGSLRELMQYQGLREKDNPDWKKAIESEKPPAQLHADVTDEAAADAYNRAING